jgi:hypothetical protein
MSAAGNSVSTVTERADIIGVLRSVHSALDTALGDTDASHIENDDELRDAYPVQWAAQWLMHAIEALEEQSGDAAQRPKVSVKPMQLSDGRADYFVSIQVGDRDVTPHVFREEYKAAYHVALYDWLLNGSGEEPDVVEFGPDDWPARVTPSQPVPAGAREALIAAKCTSTDGTFVHASMDDVLRAFQPLPAGDKGEAAPASVADAIKAYLEDAPAEGRHSDAAGGSAYELLQWAEEELRFLAAPQPASNAGGEVKPAAWLAKSGACTIDQRMANIWRDAYGEEIEPLYRGIAYSSGSCGVTDAMCEAAIDAEDAVVDRIQGFSYNTRHVIRDVRMPWPEQEIWSAPVAGPDEYQAFQKRCQIERMRRVLHAALAMPSTDREGSK